jgi:transcription antitermination factor NusG
MLKNSEEPSMIPPSVSSVTELPGRWWVGHTRARFEKAFSRDLLGRGIGYFLPMVKRVRIVGKRKRPVLLPLFPSYVFFCGDQQTRRTAMETHRLCQAIPVTDQEQLMQECAAIEQALAAGAEMNPCRSFAVGQRFRVTAGPFQGIEGTMVRHDGRARIALEISTLGMGASLEVDMDLLEPVSHGGLA